MKFTIKTLLRAMFWISVPCIVFQRPLRLMCESNFFSEVFNGLIISTYWIFWLCYSESIITLNRSQGADILGFVVGAGIQIIILSINIALIGERLCRSSK